MEPKLCGEPMLEVFSVSVNNIGKDDLFLYGKIMVNNYTYHELIYNREKNDCETIRPGGTCTLTGPSKCLTAYDYLCFELDLRNGNNRSPYKEVIRDWFDLSMNSRHYDYGTLQIKKADTIYGSWTINYALYRRAVQAEVEVMLIDCGGKDTADFYGQLWAFGNLFDEEIILFDSKSDNCINVKAGERIPLLRSAVAVSVKSSLTVCAELCGSEGEIVEGNVEFKPDCCDGDIVKDSVELKPKAGTHTKKLKLEPGTHTKNVSWKIEVKVTWSIGW